MTEETARTITAPMQGTVVSIAVAEGNVVHAGTPVMVLEAMKMEHVINAEVSGTVRRIAAAVGQTVFPGDALVLVDEGEHDGAIAAADSTVDVDTIRADLAE